MEKDHEWDTDIITDQDRKARWVVNISNNIIKVGWEDQVGINTKKGDLATGLGIMEIKEGLGDQQVGWVVLKAVLAVVWEADLAGITEEVVDLGDKEEAGLEGDNNVDNFVFFDAGSIVLNSCYTLT